MRVGNKDQLNATDEAKIAVEKIKTVAYLRYGCSDGTSTSELIKRDTELYRTICEKKGMELVDVYFDHASGRQKERLGLQKLMDDCKTGKFQRVIVKSISKLSRNTIEQVKLLRQMKENRVSLWSELEGGLLDISFIEFLETLPKDNINEKPFVYDKQRKGDLDDMLVYLDKINHRIGDDDENDDTEVEIRVGEKSIKIGLNEEVFGIIYDLILSMRGEL